MFAREKPYVCLMSAREKPYISRRVSALSCSWRECNGTEGFLWRPIFALCLPERSPMFPVEFQLYDVVGESVMALRVFSGALVLPYVSAGERLCEGLLRRPNCSAAFSMTRARRLGRLLIHRSGSTTTQECRSPQLCNLCPMMKRTTNLPICRGAVYPKRSRFMMANDDENDNSVNLLCI
ncbi:hypothetical protein SUGI_0821900 [Cryptomeria japonica]|nr:hypothetical protein SUGI_0821900 [Cryptomeria japonica]